MYIPKKKNIFKTCDCDPAYYHYYPLIGYVYKKRLSNNLSLLEGKYKRLLDIGYGSGILFPELSRLTEKVYGLEIHNKENLIYQFLRKENINNIILKSVSVLQIPFPDNFFDCVISVSTMEHIARFDKNHSLDKALSEIKRVLEPGGTVVLSFPVRNIITNYFFKLAGYSPKVIHPSSHFDIINIAKRYLKIEKMIKFPQLFDLNSAFYCSILCKK